MANILQEIVEGKQTQLCFPSIIWSFAEIGDPQPKKLGKIIDHSGDRDCYCKKNGSVREFCARSGKFPNRCETRSIFRLRLRL